MNQPGKCRDLQILRITNIMADPQASPWNKLGPYVQARLQPSSDQSLPPPFAARIREGDRTWNEFLTNHRGNRQH